MKRDSIFDWISVKTLQNLYGLLIGVNNKLRYNNAKTFDNDLDIPDVGYVKSLSGNGVNSQGFRNTDFVSDGGGGFYLPYALSDGEIGLGVRISYDAGGEEQIGFFYDFTAQAITGFTNDDPQDVLVFSTGMFTPPAPPTPAPVFSLQPISSATVVFSDNITLTALASDTNSYQWLKNGVAIPGATLDSYTISSMDAFAAGTYSVAALGLGGTTNSNNSVISYDAGRAVINNSDKKSDNSPNGSGRNITVSDGLKTKTLIATQIEFFSSTQPSLDIKQGGSDDLTMKDNVTTFAPIVGGNVSNIRNAPFNGTINIYNDN